MQLCTQVLNRNHVEPISTDEGQAALFMHAYRLDAARQNLENVKLCFAALLHPESRQNVLQRDISLSLSDKTHEVFTAGAVGDVSKKCLLVSQKM